MPSHEQIRELILEMEKAGDYEVGKYRFRDYLQQRCESDFFFFTKWVFYSDVERRGKLGRIHQELCRFITDFTRSRRKLLMMPMGHLKTSFCSQSLPLHVLIQRPETNIYFPGKWGCDQRILLANESEDKCRENLSVVREHLASNIWIAWLWPHVCWEAPKDSPLWQELRLTVPRHTTVGEPSVTAVGALTAIIGRHFDFEALDDIAGTRAGNSWEVMAKVKKFKKTARSRLHSATLSIEVGLGTHQAADDVYVDWQADPSVETMIRSIEEEHIDDSGAKVTLPLWPENSDYSSENIDKLRRDLSDPVLWAHWYMNRPVASGFTAMDWSTLREFRWDTNPGWMSQTIEFDETEVDYDLKVHKVASTASPLMRFAQGMPLERQRGRQMTIRRMFGQRPTEPGLVEHLKLKYGCEGCEHGRHLGPCPIDGCDCKYNQPPRPWEQVVKGSI